MNRGSILRTVLIVGALILILSVLGIDLKQAVENPQTTRNFTYVGEKLSYVWHTFLSAPLEAAWGWFKRLFWDIFIENMEWIRDGKPTDIERYYGPK